MKYGNPGPPITHCLGRHLLDLPAGATVDARFKVGDSKVRTMRGVSRQEFQDILAARGAELVAQDHREAGNRFVDRRELSDDRVMITSWLSPNSVRMYLTELYGLFPEARVMQVVAGESSVKLHEKTMQYFSSLSRSLRYRAPGEIPAEAGFCIDSGLVMRSVPNQEEASATIRIPGRRGLTLTYMAYVTGAPDTELLRRVSRVPSGYEGTLAAMKQLRRGKRDIGPIHGEELLVRGDAGGKRSYEFLWESQGQRASLEHPFLSMRLTTTDESDPSGEVMEAPFADDREALELWDAILDSLRLRPGAV